MKKYMTLIKNGYWKEVYLLNSEEIEVFTLESDEELLETPAPTNFIKPYWDGKKWIEKATQEEIDERNSIPENPPNEIDLLKEKVALQETVIEELMFTIIPELTGGGM